MTGRRPSRLGLTPPADEYFPQQPVEALHVDGDGQVNPVDSGLVQAAFGSVDGQDSCSYDVDCDGQINPVDSGIVQSLFGTWEDPRDVCP